MEYRGTVSGSVPSQPIAGAPRISLPVPSGFRFGSNDEPIPRIPLDRSEAMLDLSGHRVRLTGLQTVFFPSGPITKGALLQYYLDMAPVLLPHLAGRPMSMKRYPNGIHGKFFFMKRAPSPRPKWIRTVSMARVAPGASDFPIVDDVASLAWVVNLGCIDLHPWYARSDGVDRPDYFHFDLDPGDGSFERVCEVALLLRDGLSAMEMPSFVKTSGSKGLHVYVPIVRGPSQKDAYDVARAIARDLAERHPKLITTEFHPTSRPQGRVRIDYEQNAWGRTLASVYSVRPTPRATVSAPVTWDEVAEGFSLEAFRLENMPSRVRRVGDLWASMLGDDERRELAPQRLTGT